MTENQPFHNQGEEGQLATGQRTAVPANVWTQGFQAEHGREPSMSEFQAAQADGLIAKDRNPAVQQMAEGVKQFAAGARGLYETRVAPAVERSGAKDFYQEHVAPAAKVAGERVHSAIEDATSGSGSSQLATWTSRAPLLIPAAALGAAISLFLPAASRHGESVNFFSRSAGGEGGLALFFMLLVIAASVASFVVKAKWAAIVAGALSILAGLMAAVDGFGNMVGFASQSGVSVGIGSVLLGLLGLVLVAAGGLRLLALRRPTD